MPRFWSTSPEIAQVTIPNIYKFEMPGIRGRPGRIPRGAQVWAYDLGIILSLMVMVIRNNPQTLGGPQCFWHTMLNGDRVGVHGVEDGGRTRTLVGIDIAYKRKFDDSMRMPSRWHSAYRFSCIELDSLRLMVQTISDLLWRQFLWAGRAAEEYLMGVGYSEYDLLMAEIFAGKAAR